MFEVQTTTLPSQLKYFITIKLQKLSRIKYMYISEKKILWLLYHCLTDYMISISDDVHVGCHMLSRNCLPFHSTRGQPLFLWGSCFSIFLYSVLFIIVCPFYFGPLCCLFLELQLLITFWYLQTILECFLYLLSGKHV
jgi:hypothetical protein